MEKQTRYRGFISYSQHDAAWGRKLHRWLESYRVPVGVIVDLDSRRRLGRFFLDNDEMAATADIAETLRTSIESSENLIVICSPHAAKSKWVEAEIQHFRQTNRTRNVFAFIVDGEPNATDPERECFPPGLRTNAATTADLDHAIEPLGIDVRTEGRERACARLVAGMLDVNFDDLWRRDRRRRARRTTALVGGLFAVLSLYAAVLFVLTRNFNGRIAAFLSQLAQLQSDAVASDMDEDNGQYDRAIRYAMLATRTDLLHPKLDAARDELVRALHATPTHMLLAGSREPAFSIAFSPGASRLALIGKQGELRLIDLNHRKLIGRFQTGLHDVVKTVWHPCMNWLALNTGDGICHILDLDRQREIHTTPRAPAKFWHMSFSFDGDLMLLEGNDFYQVWNLENRNLADSGRFESRIYCHNPWLPWKRLLTVPGENGAMKIRDPIAKVDLAVFGGNGHEIENYDFNRAGNRLYLLETGKPGSREAELVTVDLDRYSVIRRVPMVYNRAFSEFRVSNDESELITTQGVVIVGGSSTVKIFSLKDPARYIELPHTSPGTVQGLSLMRDNDLALVYYSNGVVRLWKFSAFKAEERAKFQAHDDMNVLLARHLPLTNEVVTWGGDGSVALWDLDSYDNVTGTLNFPDTVDFLQFSADGGNLLACSKQVASVFALKRETHNGRLTGTPNKIVSIPRNVSLELLGASFTPTDDTVFLYFNTGEIGKALLAQEAKLTILWAIPPLQQVMIDQKNGLALLGSRDGIYLHDLNRDALPSLLGSMEEKASVLALSPDGQYVAAGTLDGKIMVWNAVSRSLAWEYADPSGKEVKAIAFSPDGQRLAISLLRGDAQLYEVDGWQPLDMEVVNQAYLYVESFSFSADSRMLYMVAWPKNLVIIKEISSFDLDRKNFVRRWNGGFTIEYISPIAPDRMLMTYSGSDTPVVVVSPVTNKVLAIKHDGHHGNGTVAFDKSTNTLAVGRYHGIVFWDLGWVMNQDIAQIRQMVCSGGIDPEELIITSSDAHFAPMVEKYVGLSVCDVGGFMSAPKPPPSLWQNDLAPQEFLAPLDPGAPGSPTLDVLRTYLAYYPFDSLLQLEGDQADKARLLAAAGYSVGIGVERDPKRAESLYQALADKGSGPATQNLAALLLKHKDESDKADALIARAAARGFWLSNRIIGLQAQQEGRIDDSKVALTKAFDSGDGYAAYLLAALSVETGADDGDIDGTACSWARKGAKKGDPSCLLRFAQCVEAQGVLNRDQRKTQDRLLQLAAGQDKNPMIRIKAERKLACLADPLSQ